MKQFYLVILLFLVTCLQATENHVERFSYWFNNNQAAAVSDDFDVPAETIQFSRNIDTDHLADGLHTFHIRFRDTNEKWSSTLSSFFYKIPSIEVDDNTIVAYQYWFNNQYDNAQEAETSGAVINLNEAFDMADLSDGLHTFHIRFKDATGKWSSVLSSFVYKLDIMEVADNHVEQVQYWVNNDFADAVTLEANGEQVFTLDEFIDFSSLPNGLHTFHMRFKDTSGAWSSVSSSFFYKAQMHQVMDARIIEYQYWLNNNFEDAVVANASDEQVFLLNEEVDLSQLTNGLHTFHVRFKDANGKWSSIQSSFVHKLPVEDIVENKISLYRYWVDDDFENAVVVELDDPANPYQWIAGLDMTHLDIDDFTIHFQFKDKKGLWSAVMTHEFATEFHASFTLEELEYCGPTTVFFQNTSPFADTFHWDFGDGNESELKNPEHFYGLPGTYEITLTASNSHNGDEGSFTLEIEIYPEYEFIENHFVCNEEDTFTWQGNEYSPGTYHFEYTTANGCDSVWVLNLGVNAFFSETSQSICQGQVYNWQGNEYTEPGTYEVNHTTVHGCDSTYVLHLSVHPVHYFEETHAICDGDVLEWQGNAYSQAGTFEVVYENVHGCDSVYVLHLEVNPVFYSEETHSICEGVVFEWHGSEYSEAGTFEMVYESIHACDSVYVLHLEVNPLFFSEETHSICEGDVFDWQGEEFFEAGTFEVVYESIHGCDSVYVLHLEVNPLFFSEETHSICEGEVFEWQGEEFSEAGTFEVVYESVHGCDSMYVLTLAVNPLFFSEETHSICEGEVFEWHGEEFSEAGTFEVVYESIHGCDSVYVLHLEVNPSYHFEDQHEICAGDTFEWFGNDLYEPGIYNYWLETQHGCDSLFVLELTVFHVDTDVEKEGETLMAMAQNASFQWINCDDGEPVEGATNALFTPEYTGEYAVWVTQGQCSALSDCFHVVITGLDDLQTYSAISVFPNPAKDHLQVVFDRDASAFNLRIYSLHGQKVYTVRDLSGSSYTISLAGIPAGIYILQIEKEGALKSFRFIKE